MNIDDDFDLKDIPLHSHGEEGEEWKIKPMQEAAKPLMKLALQILKTVMAIVETLPENDDGADEPISHYRQWMMENAMKLAPKISGAMATGDYILMSENAVVIKLAARELRTQTSGLEMFDYPHPEYLDTLRTEIDAFQKLFVNWVRTFVPEEPLWPDGWGLFYSKEDIENWNRLNPNEQVNE